MTIIDTPDDIIDSRDLIETAEYIADLGHDASEDEIRLYDEILSIANGFPPADWQHGETFIRHDAFQDYARELAEDIGAIPADYSWPASHIDWEAAADALLQDYTEYTLFGRTYYAR